MKKKLFIIAGPNGAGKTTFLKEFAKNKKLSYVEADEIARNISRRATYRFSMQAGRITLKKIKELQENNVSFAVETTLSGKIWLRMIKDFKKHNYFITIFFIYVDTPQEAIKRIFLRKNKKGHYIPDDIVLRRYPRSLKNFWLFYRMLVDRWFLINNSGETPFLVAYGTKKQLQIIDKDNLKMFMGKIGEEEK